MFVEVTRLFTVVLLTAAGFMLGQGPRAQLRRALRHRRHARLPRRLPLRWRPRPLPRARRRSGGAPGRPGAAAPGDRGDRRRWLRCADRSDGCRTARAARPSGRDRHRYRRARSCGSRCTSATGSRRGAARSCSRWRASRRVRSCARVPYDDSDGFLVDSSAVMDGQLLPLSRSGLFRDDLLVPRFVLDELQGMADANDERSRRAKRGLRDPRGAAQGGAVARASSSTTRCPRSTRSTPSSSRSRAGSSCGCSRTT